MEIRDYDISVYEFDKKFNGSMNNAIIEFIGFDRETNQEQRMRLIAVRGEQYPIIINNMLVEGISIAEGSLVIETKSRMKVVDDVYLSMFKSKGNKIVVLREGTWFDFTTSRLELECEEVTHSIGTVIVCGDRILLGERMDGRGWTLPGGKVEKGETDLQAAVREIKEESDLDIEPNQLVFVNKNKVMCKVQGVEKEVTSHVYLTFVSNLESLNVRAQEGEIRLWVWVKSELLSKYTIFEPSRVALDCLGLIK